MIEHLSEIISFIVGAAAGYTLKVVVNMRKNSVRAGRDAQANRVEQRGNKVGGDMAGGDITKRK